MDAIRENMLSTIFGLYGIFFGVWWTFFNETVFLATVDQLRSPTMDLAQLKLLVLASTAMFIIVFIYLFASWSVATIWLGFGESFRRLLGAVYVFCLYMFIVGYIFKGMSLRIVLGVVLLVGWIATSYTVEFYVRRQA